MKCTIWTALYELNSSKKRDYLTMREYGFLSHGKQQQIRDALIRPENYHFSEWECIAKDFDPTNYKHWRWLKKQLFIVYEALFMTESCSNWMPERVRKEILSSIRVYKMLDEEGNIIDIRPYRQKYYYERIRIKWELRCAKYQKWYDNYEYSRHPRIRNGMAQEPGKDEEREWKSEGWMVKWRKEGRRLPIFELDKMTRIPKSWKDRTKCRRQYEHNVRKRKAG